MGELTVPGGFDVAFYPFLDGVDVFYGVLEVLTYVVSLAAAQEVGIRGSARLLLD